MKEKNRFYVFSVGRFCWLERPRNKVVMSPFLGTGLEYNDNWVIRNRLEADSKCSLHPQVLFQR